MATKTEKPTQAHLKRLRQQGLVPRSRYLPSAIGFLVAVALAPSYLDSLLRATKQQLLLAMQPDSSVSFAQLAARTEVAFHAAWVLLAVGLGVVTTALLLVAVAQTGGLVFSLRSWGSGPQNKGFLGLVRQPFAVLVSQVAQLLLPVVLVWLVLAWLVVHHAPSTIAARGNLPGFIALVATQVRQLLLSAAALLTALALVDWYVQWRAFKRQSHQSPEARKREEREQQGAPETRLARRRQQSELVQLPPLDLLPYCQLVLDNGSDAALLVAYRRDVDHTPQIIAVVHATERLAVIEGAARAQVAVAVLPWLVERLRRLPADAAPPLELQLGLAEVLAVRVFAEPVDAASPFAVAVGTAAR